MGPRPHVPRLSCRAVSHGIKQGMRGFARNPRRRRGGGGRSQYVGCSKSKQHSVALGGGRKALPA